VREKECTDLKQVTNKLESYKDFDRENDPSVQTSFSEDGHFLVQVQRQLIKVLEVHDSPNPKVSLLTQL